MNRCCSGIYNVIIQKGAHTREGELGGVRIAGCAIKQGTHVLCWETSIEYFVQSYVPCGSLRTCVPVVGGLTPYWGE